MTNNMVFNLYNLFGDYMKKIFVFSITLGIIFSLLLILNYKKNINEKKYLETLYFMQLAAYENSSNVSKITKELDSYIVMKEDDNLYHVYVGIVKNKRNLEKIKEFYIKNGNNIYVREKIVRCKNFLNEIDNYEILLENSNNILSIEKEILKKFNDCENKRDG